MQLICFNIGFGKGSKVNGDSGVKGVSSQSKADADRVPKEDVSVQPKAAGDSVVEDPLIHANVGSKEVASEHCSAHEA
ncbi:hypothetical protein ACOSQ3_019122 [Xanthoceras sorbifolium]